MVVLLTHSLCALLQVQWEWIQWRAKPVMWKWRKKSKSGWSSHRNMTVLARSATTRSKNLSLLLLLLDSFCNSLLMFNLWCCEASNMQLKLVILQSWWHNHCKCRQTTMLVWIWCKFFLRSLANENPSRAQSQILLSRKLAESERSMRKIHNLKDHTRHGENPRNWGIRRMYCSKAMHEQFTSIPMPCLTSTEKTRSTWLRLTGLKCRTTKYNRLRCSRQVTL